MKLWRKMNMQAKKPQDKIKHKEARNHFKSEVASGTELNEVLGKLFRRCSKYNKLG